MTALTLHADLGHLIRFVAAVDGIERVRYTSPHPKDLRAETIALLQELAGQASTAPGEVAQPAERLRNLGELLEVNLDAYVHRERLAVDPVFHLLSGGAMLAACFLATEVVTSPLG